MTLGPGANASATNVPLGPPARPAQTVLAGDAAHPCRCVQGHTPRPAEFERHHIHMASEQQRQGLTLATLTAANEWAGPDAAIGDEHAAYWVLLCPTSHSFVHVLLRRLAAAKGGPVALGPYVNPFIRLLAEEGNRRVMAHGGWKETA